LPKRVFLEDLPEKNADPSQKSEAEAIEVPVPRRKKRRVKKVKRRDIKYSND
jgi:hypothetical protein